MQKYSHDKLAGALLALLWVPLMITGLGLLDGLVPYSHNAGAFSVTVTAMGVFGMIAFRVLKRLPGKTPGEDKVRFRLAFWSSAVQVAVLLIVMIALDMGAAVADGTNALLGAVLVMGMFGLRPRKEDVARRRDLLMWVLVPAVALLAFTKLAEASEPALLVAAGLHAAAVALVVRSGQTTAEYGAAAMTLIGVVDIVATAAISLDAYNLDVLLRGGAAGLVLGAASLLAWWCLRRVSVLTFAITSLGGVVFGTLQGGYGFERPDGPVDWIVLSALALSVGGAVWTAARDR